MAKGQTKVRTVGQTGPRSIVTRGLASSPTSPIVPSTRRMQVLVGDPSSQAAMTSADGAPRGHAPKFPIRLMSHLCPLESSPAQIEEARG